MPSKLVTDRQKSANSVVASGETHAGRIAAELEALLSPHLRKGEKMPDVSLFTHIVARALAEARDRMVAADEAHQAELADDAAPREARDEAAAALYTELTELREWLTGLYGAAALARLGFTDATPRDPAQLERFAGEVARALGARDLPKPRRKGIRWDTEETVLRIEGLRGALRGHLKDVAREAREAEATLLAKTAAIAAYDDRFSRAATFLVGLFRLAGHPELAARVRPSSRRPGQIEADAPPAEPGGEAPVEPEAAAPLGG
ncbi:hypothetical protein ACSRUE_46555 [Sorangium sp. KYC3313]|uniref:hypothetical protein n=1 Tax=Sorangium sp. KYC3313 TaxID=3449740 RepID=UPI003F8B43CF